MRSTFRTALLGCALAATLAACDAPDTALAPKELQQTAKSLASLSAEAGLLAAHLAHHDVTPQFAAVHQQALGDESLKLSRKLARPVAVDQRTAHDALALLNTRFQTQVARVAQASAQPVELGRLQDEFRALKAQAGALGKPA